ncbi:putative C2 domain-containing protein [Helianthus debilis subsp. tardiflorus]
MESRRLEIVLHSAKDLYNVKHFGTMDPYAMVWFAGGGMVSEIRTTAVARKAGSCPVWEFSMEYEAVPMKNDYILFCEIQHDGKLLDRKIGEVQVPFTELLAGDASRKNARYPVKIESGEVMGSIILSHKFIEQVVISRKKDDQVTDSSKVSSTSGTKNKANTETLSSGKSSKNNGNGKGKAKEHTPIKKVNGKKKDGMMKSIAKSVEAEVEEEVEVEDEYDEGQIDDQVDDVGGEEEDYNDEDDGEEEDY